MNEKYDKMTTPMGFPYILVTRTKTNGGQMHYIKFDVERLDKLCELTGYNPDNYYGMVTKYVRWKLESESECTPQIQAIYNQANREVMHPLFLCIPGAGRVIESYTNLIMCVDWYNANSEGEVEQAVSEMKHTILALDEALPSLIKVVQLDKMATELQQVGVNRNKINTEMAFNRVLSACDCDVEPESVQSVTIDCDVFTALITFK